MAMLMGVPEGRYGTVLTSVRHLALVDEGEKVQVPFENGPAYL